jgi:hypothetical protein
MKDKFHRKFGRYVKLLIAMLLQLKFEFKENSSFSNSHHLEWSDCSIQDDSVTKNWKFIELLTTALF